MKSSTGLLLLLFSVSGLSQSPVSKFSIQKNFPDSFAFTKNWNYPWYVISDDEGKFESVFGDSIDAEDTAHLYHTANMYTNHQGGQNVFYCKAKLVLDTLVLEFDAQPPAYTNQMKIRIRGDHFLSAFWAAYPARTKKLTWTIQRQKLILNRNSFKKGDIILGYFESTFTESWGDGSADYFYRGYFKTIIE